MEGQKDRQKERQMDGYRQLTGISLASLVIICSRYAGIVLIGGPVLVMVWKKYGLRLKDRHMERQKDRQLTGISLASLVIICSKYAGIVLIGGPVLVMVWKKYGLRLAMSRRARHA